MWHWVVIVGIKEHGNCEHQLAYYAASGKACFARHQQAAADMPVDAATTHV
jgi:hypothetical protein